MNRIFFIVYSFDCSGRHPVFYPVWRLTRKVRGKRGIIRTWCRCPLSYLLLNNVFSFGVLSPYSRQPNTQRAARH